VQFARFRGEPIALTNCDLFIEPARRQRWGGPGDVPIWVGNDFGGFQRDEFSGSCGVVQTLDGQINLLDREIMAWHKTNETSRRLATIPGIDFITASAIAATTPDPPFFRCGREFVA
jgi:hypothetical protein